MHAAPDISPNRLGKIITALTQHDASLADAQLQTRTRRDSLMRWSTTLTFSACGIYALLATSLRAFPQYVPAAIVAHAHPIVWSSYLAMWLGIGGWACATLAQAWRFTSRPVRHMLPKLGKWIQLEYGLCERLVAIGGIQELTVAERSLAEEADAMERRRKIWFTAISLGSVAGGLWTALKGDGGLATSLLGPGAILISNLSASIYTSQLRRYASVMRQSIRVIEQTQSQLAHNATELETVVEQNQSREIACLAGGRK